MRFSIIGVVIPKWMHTASITNCVRLDYICKNKKNTKSELKQDRQSKSYFEAMWG